MLAVVAKTVSSLTRGRARIEVHFPIAETRILIPRKEVLERLRMNFGFTTWLSAFFFCDVSRYRPTIDQSAGQHCYAI